MAPHSGTLAWKIPWTQEPGGLQSMGSHRVRHAWSDLVAAAADCSPPGFSVHGIPQARTLEWVVMISSRGSFWPRDWTQVSCIAGSFFTIWTTGKSFRRVWHELKQLLGIQELSKINGRGCSVCVISKKQNKKQFRYCGIVLVAWPELEDLYSTSDSTIFQL